MRVSIFTPTQRPGIDVTVESIRRQSCKAKLQWILSDELFPERWTDQECQTALYELDSRRNLDTAFFKLNKKEGYKRNLAAGYNKAMEIARSWGADIFISLQDYIWVPEDGVSNFIKMYEELEVKERFKAIYTGITSITSDPPVSEITNPNGMYTIFSRPFTAQPQNIAWMDIRYRHDIAQAYTYHVCPEIEYETNWACVPRTALYDERLSYDEDFDQAVAYENQDFAYRAKSLGYHVLIDMNNQVLSLPHKQYFAEEWAEEQPLTQKNRELCETKWGS